MIDQIEPLGTYLTATEAAEVLGISRQAVHNRISRGTIPSDRLRRVGDVVVIEAAWLEKNK